MLIVAMGSRGRSLESVLNGCPVGIHRNCINNQAIKSSLVKGVECGVEAACVRCRVYWHGNDN